MLLAGVSYPGGLPSEMVQPQPGATISIRTALRYAMRCTGATREDVANATLIALRAFYNGDAMRAALAALHRRVATLEEKEAKEKPRK